MSAPSPGPTLSCWSPPEELRRPLLDARGALRAAEDALAEELVSAFRTLVVRAAPGERKVLADIYAVTCEGRGEHEAAAKLRAAWAACEAAHANVVRAEDALQRALPSTIDIVLAPPLAPSPVPEESAP